MRNILLMIPSSDFIVVSCSAWLALENAAFLLDGRYISHFYFEHHQKTSIRFRDAIFVQVKHMTASNTILFMFCSCVSAPFL